MIFLVNMYDNLPVTLMSWEIVGHRNHLRNLRAWKNTTELLEKFECMKECRMAS